MTTCVIPSLQSFVTRLSPRQEIERRLAQLLPERGDQDLVNQAMREGTLAPGKRIRPLLLMMIAEDLGCSASHKGLTDLACAVEMVHAASLMLDDMPCMDNAELRRGRPTIHRQFGESVAILAAIALLSKAFAVVAAAEGLALRVRNQAVAELADAVGIQGLVRGQFQDLADSHQQRSPEAILLTNEFKTSMLFGASMKMAAIAAGVSSDIHHSLHHFALELGQAFQLLDDLCDGHSDTGKDSHQDIGKSTLVNLLGAQEVKQRLGYHLLRADQHLAAACGDKMRTRQFVNSWFEQKLAAVA
ncbi:polyprenyl synthetase family protein [Pantoea sp. A4]|uniref:polyprenyl synthetase family protein n=1 Tax=Pantoea sp. A4 TaxID=1225184 RepID=UPI0003690639|nr:polyprenyl synthetase family protein [Pantoea sp. A4]